MPQVSERAAAPFASMPAVNADGEISSRGCAYLLAMITLAGAVLRLLHLGAKSLWTDEPLTVAIARMPWPHFVANWQHGEAAFQGAYFLLMRGWLHLGQTEFWIRLPSALFAIASIPLLYAVARTLIGQRAALVATLLYALNPTGVYYSQEARSYTMAMLLVLASTWFFVRAVQEDRERDWVLWVVFSVVSFYSHLLACLVIVAQAASLLALRDAKMWRRMLVHAFLILLLCAPGLVSVLHAQAGGLAQSDWPRATPKQLLHLAMFLGGSGEKVVLFAILWIAAVRTIWRERLLQHPREIFWHGALLISWAALPAIVLALFSIYSPLFVQRYMIFSLPATMMLAGGGASVLTKRHLGAWLVLALCVSSVVNVFMGYHKPREDWRSATAAVLASAADGDAVLVYPPYARTGFDYYYYDLRGNGAPRVRVFAQYYEFGEDEQALLGALARDQRAFPHVWVLLRERSSGKDTLQDYSSDVARQLQLRFGDPRKYKFQGLTMLEFGG
jgi:mannosyltransferase